MSEENTNSADELRNITHPEKFDIQGHGLTELYTPNQVIKILEYYAQHVKPKTLTDEEIFGGENAEEHNVLLSVIKERGYEFFEKTPKTTMTVRLIEDLHKLGYKIVKPKTLKDDEIDEKVNTLDDTTHYDAGYVKGFESGSEWARELIEGKQ